MTTIEKTVVLNALKEYAENEEHRSGLATDQPTRMLHQRNASNARTVLTYWPDVVAATCGSVKI